MEYPLLNRYIDAIQYADSFEGIVNASCEFCLQSLIHPLFLQAYNTDEGASHCGAPLLIFQ